MRQDTVIVGAGAAGLAVAATLTRQGLPCTVIEQSAGVGSSWRGRYDSLRLHTVRQLSGLPGLAIPRSAGRWVARDDLVDYLEAYADRFGIRPEFGVQVTRIARQGEGWQLETSSGARTAGIVVVATGLSRTPYLPDWPGRDSFPGSLLHSSAYREPAAYAGQKVLVVGAGNSAAEIATELTEVAGEVLLAVRTPPNIVPRATLGVPSQLVGIALSALPERVLNPVFGALRRTTIPDLSGQGLPAPPGDAFNQFVRSQVVPILDHGFVAAVQAGAIRVVPAVEAIDGSAVQLAGDCSSGPTPSWPRRDTAPIWRLWSATSACSTRQACRRCTGRGLRPGCPDCTSSV